MLSVFRRASHVACLATALALSSCTSEVQEPQPIETPLLYINQWCLDPVTSVLLDDDVCDTDSDGDGWLDAVIVYPWPGATRPPVGSKVAIEQMKTFPRRPASPAPAVSTKPAAPPAVKRSLVRPVRTQ